MKSNSIIVRLLGVLIITITILTYITSLVLSNRLKRVLEAELHEEVFVILQSLDWAMRPLLDGEDEEGIQRLIDNISAYPIVDTLRLYDDEQIVSYSNAPLEKGIVVENQCVAGVFENNAIKKSYEDLEAGVFEAAIPVKGSSYTHESGSDIRAVLYLSADTDYVQDLWGEVASGFQIVFVSANIIILILVGLFVYFFVGRPLNEFTKASRAVTNKNYDYKIQRHFFGEFEEFREVYDNMRTSIKLYTDELDLAKQEAERASEAKMIFLTNMSHEIRTPLNSILGFTEILEEKESDLEKKNELKIIHKSGSHLLTVINDLLDFSKIESEQMELENIIFSVREMLRDVSDFFTVQLNQKSIEYTYEVGGNVPYHCNGDANKIRQILINIISNAIKFTKEGTIHVAVDYQVPHLIFRVSDTGVGIRSDKLDSIFDAFSQSDNSIARRYGGTGLGLAICKKFALMMDGDITVESQLGKGTSFTISVEVAALESTKLLGRSILCKWINADSDLSDLVFDMVQTLPERLAKLHDMVSDAQLEAIRNEIHALKGLMGNFQMEELYSLFKSADKLLKKEVVDYNLLNGIIDDADNIVSMVYEAAQNQCKTKEDIDRVKLSEVTQKKEADKRLIDVLVAEDIKENQLLMAKMLEGYVGNIDFANNGIEAMAMLKEKHYDCLLLDIQMPVMSGEDVLNALNDKRAVDKDLETPHIIVVTAHATLDEKNKYLGLGADDYISKPINKTKLRNKLCSLN